MMTSTVWQQHESRLANRLNRLRVTQILELANSSIRAEKCRVLDVGCAKGTLSRVLSESCQVVAVDVDVSKLQLGKREGGKLEFLLSDVDSLPFREGSFDVLLCASVFEHLLNLDGILAKLKKLLKEDGCLVVGYPLETWLFKLIWRIISPHEYACIDSHSGKIEDYWNSPRTHKQNYLTIRKMLRKHFSVVFQGKLPFSWLPDLFSFYECAKLRLG